MADITYDDLVRALQPIAKDRTLRDLKGLPEEMARMQNDSSKRTNKAFGKMYTTVQQTIGAGSSALAKAVAESGSLLLQGGGRISDVANILGESLGELPGKFGKIGESLGASVGFMAGYLEDSVDVFRDLQFVGAGLNGRLQDLRRTASQTRLNLDQFANLVANNNEKLVGFGAGVQDSIDRFASISNQMFELDAGAYAKQFMALGYSVEEMNEMLADNIQLTRRQARIENMSAQEQIQSAANYAKQLDVLAKLTGQDAKAARDEISQRQRQGATQAKLRQLEQRGVEGVQESYRDVQTSLQEGPQVLRDLFDDVLQVGVPVTEATKNFAAVNDEAFNLAQQAAQAVQRGDTEKAQALAQRAAEETARFAQSEEGYALATLGRVSNVAETQSSVLEETGPLIDSIQSYTEDFEGEAGSFVEAFRGLRREIESEQTTQIDDTDPVLDLVNSAERAMANTSSALQREIANIIASPEVQGASRTAANKIEGIFDPSDIREFGKDLRMVISDISTEVTAIDRLLEDPELSKEKEEQLRTKRKDLTEAQNTLADGSASLSERREAEEKLEAAKVFIDGISDDVANVLSPQADLDFAAEGYQQAVDEGNEAAANFYKEALESAGQTVPESRQSGSLGETGSLIENFGSGTLAELHGRESVLTEEQLKNLASNSMSYGSSTVADAISNLANRISNPENSAQETNNNGVNLNPSQIESLVKSSFASSYDLNQNNQQSLPGADFTSAISTNLDVINNIQRDNDKKHQEFLIAVQSLKELVNSIKQEESNETSINTQEPGSSDTTMLSTAIGELVKKLDEQTSIARKHLKVNQGQGPNMFKSL